MPTRGKGLYKVFLSPFFNYYYIFIDTYIWKKKKNFFFFPNLQLPYQYLLTSLYPLPPFTYLPNLLFLFDLLITSHKTPKVTPVIGTVRIKYIHQSSLTTILVPPPTPPPPATPPPPVVSKAIRFVPNKPEIKAGGKKSRPNTAIVRMATVSLRASCAIEADSTAMRCEDKELRLAMRL